MNQLRLGNNQTPILKAWGHVQHELLFLTWGVMDIALITPVALAIMKWARYWPAGLVMVWLLLIMLLPFYLARLMSALKVAVSRQQTFLAVGLLLTLFISLRALLYESQSLLDFSWVRLFFAHVADSNNQLWPRDLIIFFLTVIMWWRGVRLVNRTFHVNGVGLRIRSGALLFAPIAILPDPGRAAWNVTPFVLLFFLAGLTAVALIRAEQVEQEKSGRSASLGPRWLIGVSATSLLTVFVAGALAAVLSGESAVVVVGWLAPLWAALYLGGGVVAITFIYVTRPLLILAGMIIDWLALLLARLGQFLAPEGLPTPTPTEEPFGAWATAVPNEIVETIGAPNANTRIIWLLLMLAVVLVVALGLGRLYRQTLLATRAGESTQRVPGAGGKILGDGRLGRRLWRRLGWLRGWRAAVSIRRIYRQMSQAAAAAGFPRAESETPYEYLETLAKAWPRNTADSQLITQAYVKVRYGQLPEAREELEPAREAWKRLERAQPATPASAATSGRQAATGDR